MLHNLAGGYWGAVIRRPLEAAATTLPLLAVLFIPVLIGMPALYPLGLRRRDRVAGGGAGWWAGSAEGADPRLQAGLPERALLHRPGGRLLRRSGSSWRCCSCAGRGGATQTRRLR